MMIWGSVGGLKEVLEGLRVNGIAKFWLGGHFVYLIPCWAADFTPKTFGSGASMMMMMMLMTMIVAESDLSPVVWGLFVTAQITCHKLISVGVQLSPAFATQTKRRVLLLSYKIRLCLTARLTRYTSLRSRRRKLIPVSSLGQGSLHRLGESGHSMDPSNVSKRIPVK